MSDATKASRRKKAAPNQPNTEKRRKPNAGSFKKGNLANPAGRPVSQTREAAKAATRLLALHRENITKATIRNALTGDVAAQRLCLERLLPPRKGAPVELNLPGLNDLDQLDASTKVLLEAVAAGEVTPDEARHIGDLIELRRKVLEAKTLEKRLAELEASLAG